MFWAGSDITNDIWIPIDGRRVPTRWIGLDSLDWNFVDDIEDFHERQG